MSRTLFASNLPTSKEVNAVLSFNAASGARAACASHVSSSGWGGVGALQRLERSCICAAGSIKQWGERSTLHIGRIGVRADCRRQAEVVCLWLRHFGLVVGYEQFRGCEALKNLRNVQG